MRPRALVLTPLLLVLTGCSADPPESPGAEVGGAAVEVVDSRQSRLVDLAPGRAGRAASVWRRCGEPDCRRPRYAVAVTDDGFATRRVPDLPQRGPLEVTGAGDAGFVVVQRGRPRWLLTPGGVVRPLEAERRAPVADGEVVVAAGQRPSAVDPSAGTRHPVPAPPGARTLWQEGEQLRAVVHEDGGRADYAWSDDGGASWQRVGLPVRGALWQRVRSRRPTLLEGGDGATLFPFLAAHRLDDHAVWRSRPGPRRPLAYTSDAAELPDGRLLVVVEAWSDQRGGPDGPGTRPGLWVSTGRAWVSWERVRPGAPFARTVPGLDLLGLRRTGRSVEVLAVGPDGRSAWLSRDEGRGWRRVRAR